MRHVWLLITGSSVACGDVAPAPAPPPHPHASQVADPLAALDEEQLLLYELQEDYDSWAARRGHCASEYACWSMGRCSTSADGGCVARTAMDCLWSGQCADVHACSVRDGRCELSPKPFHPALHGPHVGGHGERLMGFLFEQPVIHRALRLSHCASLPPGPPPYVGRNLLSCRFSEACLVRAHCRLVDGECEIDPYMYELRFHEKPRSTSPPHTSTATPEVFSVSAASDFRTDLVAPPEHWHRTRGRCGATPECFELGLCSPTSNGDCRAVRLIDCFFSTACRTHARCRPEAGQCVAGGRRLFERVSPTAAEHAARPFRDDPDNAFCSVASNTLECRHSHECAREGRCYFGNGRCVAGSDTACRRSTSCGEAGRCTFDRDTPACK